MVGGLWIQSSSSYASVHALSVFLFFVFGLICLGFLVYVMYTVQYCMCVCVCVSVCVCV